MQVRARKMVFLFAVILLCVPGFGGAQQEEKKPLVLVVYADWCPLCQNLKPVLALMNERYRRKIRFVRLDVTSEATTAKSRQQARSLGLEPFFDKYYTLTSLVVIQDPAGHEVFRAVHDYDFQHYATVLDQQLGAKQK